MKTRSPSSTAPPPSSARLKRWSEAAAIALMLIGVAMVCQPVVHFLFRWGFLVTLSGIVAFTAASHLKDTNG